MPGKFGGFNKPVQVSLFIHDHLARRGEDYAWRVWKAYVRALRAEGDYKPCTYSSFTKYFWLLKKLGLIHFTRRARASKRFLQPIHYYALTAEKTRDAAWNNPLKAYRGR